MELTFARIKDTKNTVRFGELDQDGNVIENVTDAVVGGLYIKKDAAAKLDNPERITVTINGV